MWYPAAYPQAISAAAWGWTSQFPVPDPAAVWWVANDYPEADLLAAYIPSYSSRPFPGQDLDLAGPTMVAVPSSVGGQVDYGFFAGTSAATPHVSGVAALMLQKNPALTPAQIEAILEATAVPFGAGCRTVREAGIGPGNWPTFSDAGNIFFFDLAQCWPDSAAGHGLLQAQVALSATPLP
jgi:subtilisin family serine protease